MPTRRELKDSAHELIRNTKPHPCIVGLVYVLIIWIIGYLTAKINGGPIAIDLNALYSGNAESAIRIQMNEPTFLSSLLVTAFQLISVLIGFGFTKYVLNVSRKQSAEMGNLFDGFAVFPRVIWLSIVRAALIFLWSLLFIVPGFIAAYKYSMATYLLLDHPDWTAIQCLQESKAIMDGHKSELFVLDLSLLGWYILGCIRPAQVYTQPFTGVTHALYYNNLIGYQASASSETDGKKPWEY